MSWSALTSREQKMFVRLFSAGVMGLLCAVLYVLVREKLIVFCQMSRYCNIPGENQGVFGFKVWTAVHQDGWG